MVDTLPDFTTLEKVAAVEISQRIGWVASTVSVLSDCSVSLRVAVVGAVVGCWQEATRQATRTKAGSPRFNDTFFRFMSGSFDDPGW